MLGYSVPVHDGIVPDGGPVRGAVVRLLNGQARLDGRAFHRYRYKHQLLSGRIIIAALIHDIINGCLYCFISLCFKDRTTVFCLYKFSGGNTVHNPTQIQYFQSRRRKSGSVSLVEPCANNYA